MTEHEPAPEPEVLAALRAWAAATDPAADPVGGAAIRRAGATGRARWTSHRALLVAAAVIVALLGATAVWVVGRADPDAVITDPGPAEEDGIRLDVVVDTAGIDLELPGATRAVHLEPVCTGAGSCPDAPDDLPRPVELGVSLVWSGRVPAGTRWEVVVDAWTCGSDCAAGPDGTPPPDEREPRTCRSAFAVDGPTLAVVGITMQATAPTQVSCGVTVDGPTPRLTVPPAFTLRPVFPWTCGTGAVRPPDLEPFSEEREEAELAEDVEARACLADLHRRGEDRAELPVVEVGAVDQTERAWWRTSPDEGLVVIRAADFGGGRWTTESCARLVEDGIGRYQTDGCVDRRELDLVYEPPATAPAPSPSSTAPSSTPGDEGRRDLVVVFADAGAADPTIADRWVLVDGGTPVDDGPLVPLATSLESVDLPRTGDLAIRWDRQDCSDACPPVGPDGHPVGAGTIDQTACEEAVPPGSGTVVVRFQSVDGAPGGATCDVSVVDALPALTVPPAWSLRERYPTDCGAQGIAGATEFLACLQGALDEARSVELPALDLVIRVAEGEVTVTRPPADAGGSWAQQRCTGLGIPGYGEPGPIGSTSCAPEEELGLDPP